LAATSSIAWIAWPELYRIRMRPLPLHKEVHRQPTLHQPRQQRQVACGREQIDPHRVELPDAHQVGVLLRSDKVGGLDEHLADLAIDRRIHLAIAQVDLRVLDVGLGRIDLGLGREDVRFVIGPRLLHLLKVGLDLCATLLERGHPAVHVVDRRGIARQKRTLPPFDGRRSSRDAVPASLSAQDNKRQRGGSLPSDLVIH
jgi:hypothetical protein